MNTELKAALECLRNPTIYNQALIDCSNALNLSKATLEQHFVSWLWLDEGQSYNNGVDEAYAIQLGEIEERLVIQGLIYEEGLPT